MAQRNMLKNLMRSQRRPRLLGVVNNWESAVRLTEYLKRYDIDVSIDADDWQWTLWVDAVDLARARQCCIRGGPLMEVKTGRVLRPELW